MYPWLMSRRLRLLSLVGLTLCGCGENPPVNDRAEFQANHNRQEISPPASPAAKVEPEQPSSPQSQPKSAGTLPPAGSVKTSINDANGPLPDVQNSPLQQTVRDLLTRIAAKELETRYDAIDEVESLEDQGDKFVPEFIAALKDEDVNIRIAAMQALSKFGSKALPAIPPILDLLRAKETTTKKAVHMPTNRMAVDYVFKSIGREGMPQFVIALEDENEDVRHAAATGLIAIGEEARPSLVAAIQHKNAGVRREALIAFDRMREPSPDLFEQFSAALMDADADVRLAAARALARLGPRGRAAIPLLIQALVPAGDPLKMANPIEKFAESAFIAERLSQIGEPAVVPLIEALKDNRPVMRMNASLALSQMNAPRKEAVLPLIKMLERSEEFERRAAIVALKSIGTDAMPAVPLLGSASQDKQFPFRNDAVAALGAIGEPSDVVLPILVKALKDEDSQVRWEAAGGLAQMGSKAKPAVGVLIEALQGGDNIVFFRVIETLGLIGADAKQAVPTLVKLLDHEEFGMSARIALEKIDPKAIPQSK